MITLLTKPSGTTTAFIIGMWLAVSGLAFAFGPYSVVRQHGGALLEEQPRQASEAVLWLAALEPEVWGAYALFQWVDLGVALLTALALFVALAFSLSRLTLWPVRRVGAVAVLLPLALFTTEATENTLLAIVLAAYPTSVEASLAAVSTVTSVKLPLGLLAFASAAAGLVAVAIRSIWRRARPSQPRSGPA
ncbi:MAG: hypothetical protein AAGI71_07970 [Bacteroidota bacterium]